MEEGEEIEYEMKREMYTGREREERKEGVGTGVREGGVQRGSHKEQQTEGNGGSDGIRRKKNHWGREILINFGNVTVTAYYVFFFS